MKRRVGSAGFTIVEAMVVLAVTGGLFVLIVGTISGRQRSNEFTQAINDARTYIQQITTETRNGEYPSSGGFHCEVQGGGIAISAVGAKAQGQNSDCVFLGKIMQFTVQGLDDRNVLVYPVAGKRTATTLADADAKVVVHASPHVDESATYLLKYGLRVAAMKAGTDTITGFGVLSSLDSTNASNGNGDQQFDLYGVKGALGSSRLTDTTRLSDGATDLLVKNPDGGIKICFESGTTDQYGLVTVGNNGSQLSADLKIMNKGGTPCGL